MTPPKDLVRRAFNRAAITYDSAADVQRHACERLALELARGFSPSVVLDAGCGTGYGLRLLLAHFPAARGIGIDNALAMLREARPLLTLAGDIEKLPLLNASVDLYWSSLSIQWCDTNAVLHEAVRVLRPGGHLALSSLGPSTFSELRTAFAASDDYSHTLAFTAPEVIPTRAMVCGLREILVHRESLVTYHADLRALLHSIKSIGANQHGGNRRRGLMGRGVFARAEAAYERLRQPNGLPLTYDMLYLTARK